jgi:DNA-binding HxlR family transcriptional regulator
MQKLIRKSTNATTMDAVGAIIRGKYTLLIIFALVTKALDASVKLVEKKVQGSMPADTISA